jgi:multiple sugar transport system substrate-binding protein
MKKVCGFLSLLLVLLALTTGCSSKSSATAESPNGVTTLSLGLWGTSDEIKREQDLVNSFMKENPKIKVKLVYKDWDSYWTWLTAQAAAKDLPDIFKMDPAYLPQYADLGAMKDLTSLIKQNNFDMSNYSKSVIDSLQSNGAQVALPRDANTVVFAYNKDMLKKAGIADPSEELTWTQVLDMAKKLTIDANGNSADSPNFDYKHIKQWGISVDPASQSDSVLEPELYSNGATLVDSNHNLSLNTPQAQQVLNFFKDLTVKYHVNVPSSEMKSVGNDPTLTLATKRVAMSFTGSWNMQDLKNAGINFGITLPPKFNETKTVIQPTGYAMSPYTTKEKAAWKLLSWISGPDGQKVMASKGQALPANKQSIDAFKNSSTDNTYNTQVFFDAAQYAIPDPYFKGKQKLWWEYLPQKLELPLNGQGDLSSAIKDVDSLWKANKDN